ncbi:MAG: riboflavin synthase [Deltaproteobacteria bacterium]|nr:riboflavin synthase [Deltaproteobacteria bacterium]MBW2219575.1 riboflavin synthase [Deltaproteobacteria bacterium]
MFTGIIEGLGTITGIQSSGQGSCFSFNAEFDLGDTKTGDSIAVNGACLTVVKVEGSRFKVDVAPETFSLTNLGHAKVGERVNLERALSLSGRLDGHLVSGHIDGTGTIKSRQNLGNAIIVSFSIPESMTRYMIRKGSVAVDGISLTINDCRSNGFDVSIIPHTASLTTVGFKKVGETVNIETDMIGKYVERFIQKSSTGTEAPESKKTKIDIEFLAKTGFLK